MLKNSPTARTRNSAVKTFKSEGMLGLYKGFLPQVRSVYARPCAWRIRSAARAHPPNQWLRIGPHTIVTFIVYEHLRHLAGVLLI